MDNNFNDEDKDKNVIITKIINIDDITDNFSKEEVEEYSKYAIISYIVFLFLIPILIKVHKKSEYVLFHVNEGFNLFALELFIFIVLGLLSSIFVKVTYSYPMWLSVVNFVLYATVVILMLLGIVNAVNGKSKTLPIIGKYKFIK